jgi:putative hydrolase of the HAD superfamily
LPIRAVIFDIGGVLEITPRTGWVERWEDRLSMPPRGLAERLRDVWRAGDVGGITLQDVERSTAKALDLDQPQLQEFMNDLWNEYLGALNTELAAYFASLRPRYKTGIISNSFVGAREKEQERYGFGDMCDLIIYSHEVGYKKPDPRIYQIACERLGVLPEEAIFLDDVPQAIDAAQALGMHGIIFHDNAQAIADIQSLLDADR